jgi:hypothetical protein
MRGFHLLACAVALVGRRTTADCECPKSASVVRHPFFCRLPNFEV